jgi:hypothetical protein
VILLQNSNEWNLPRKRRILEKYREEQVLKSKRGEISFEKLHVSKKKRMRFTSCWERFYQKKERKEITFFYSAKSDVWPHPFPHIICIFSTFFLDFFLSYPLSLHHSSSTMIICHTNSLEFSFAFTIYKVKHRYLFRVNHHKNISREEKSDQEDE